MERKRALGGKPRRAGAPKLRRRAGPAPQAGPDTAALVRQLEVHRVELEAQNVELRAARARADEVADRFVQIFDSALSGYLVLDEHLAVSQANSEAAALLGVDRPGLVGRSFLKFVHAGELATVSASLAQAVRTGGDALLDVRLRSASGEVRRARLTATGTGRRHGAEPGRATLLVALVDQTERVRRAAELEEALSLLHTAQEIAGLGTFVVDVADETWTHCERFARIAGLAPPDGGRQRLDAWRALVHPDDRASVAGRLAACVEGRARFEAEFRIVRPSDGQERWIRSLGRLERDPIGGPRRLVGTVQDVTDRKRFELEREQMRRSAEAACARAESAMGERDRFLATLSHELRNPLAPIAHSLLVLDRAPSDSDEARRARSIARRQVAHLARLVDDLLETTRVVRGKVQLQLARVDLNDVVARTAEDHRPIFKERGLGLEVHLVDEPLCVDADATRVAQALGNLLRNAAKFSGPGTTTTVMTGRDRAAGRALVSVSDQGAGIDRDVLASLFQPFVQGDATVARSQGGLGLGLAIVRGIAELHGGDVVAESPGPGKGAAFTLRFPLSKTPKRPAAQAAPPAEPARRRVLVVEDNEDAAEALRDVLVLARHDVDVARDGREGLAKIRSSHPEVVLCDIGLPDIDGYELARTVRADPSLRGTRLVALSGYAGPDDVRRASEAGFDAHVAKPAGLEKLEQILNE